MNVMNFLAMILTIVTAVGIPTTIYALFASSVDVESGIGKVPAKFIIYGLAVLIILLLIRYYNFEKQTIEKQILVSLKYYSLLHDFRNEINQMELYYKEIEQKKRSWDMALFTKTVEEVLVKGLDYLCETMSAQAGGQKICGCVKHIVGNSFGDINYNNASVMTFVRSGNTDSARKRLDIETVKKAKVFENTDFRSIILGEENGNSDVFYQQNLLKFDEQLRKVGKRYDNTTPHWEDYYRATIVAPIRIANKRLFYKPENECYDILGFLCVDTMRTDVFTEKQRENFTYTIKAYAAVFYNALSKYQYYMMKFDEYEKKSFSSSDTTEKVRNGQNLVVQGHNQNQNQLHQTQNSKKKNGRQRKRSENQKSKIQQGIEQSASKEHDQTQ